MLALQIRRPFQLFLPAKFPQNQKVEALANPHQKIGGVGQDKNSSAEVALASTSGSAPATTQATLATPATVEPEQATPSTPATVAKPISSKVFDETQYDLSPLP